MNTEDANGSPLKEHVAAMKSREQELRERSEVLLVRADAIQKERMELEAFLYQLEKKNKTMEERLKSLASL